MKSNRLWLYSLISCVLPETRCFNVKRALLRWCGLKIGDGVRIASSVRFLGCGGIEIGNDVWIGPNSFLFASANSNIIISDCADIAPCVRIITGSHIVDVRGDHMAGRGYCKDVLIESGCWIGAGAIILPGVRLPKQTVVGAGSVINRGFNESQILVAGVPALIKKRYRD